MAHELKAKHIQTETLENKADDRILLRNILSYIEDHSSSFEDEDVVSKRFVEERLSSIGEEKYIGSIASIESVDDDIPDPEEDMLIVTRDTLFVYWYDGDEWHKIGGGETPESIKVKYESNENTNAFTDANQSKLAGIATGATKNANTDELSEGIENKYFTEARAVASKLAGYVKAATVSAISSATSILEAIGILEKALDNKVDKVAGKGLISDAEKLIFADKYTKNETDNLISGAISSLIWKNDVAEFADLATEYPDAIEGWTSVVNNENKIYRFDGTNWVPIGDITIPMATASVDGKMSKEDFVKLRDIEAEATKNHKATTAQAIEGEDDEAFITPKTCKEVVVDKLSLGVSNRIKFNNTDGSKLSDSPNLRFNGPNNSFTAGERVGAEGEYSFVVGQNNEGSGRRSFVTGASNKATAEFSIAEGALTVASGMGARASGKGFTAASGKFLIASGVCAFNHSASESAQVAGHGALGNHSAILGGMNHNIPATSPRSAIIGGNGQKMPENTPDTVMVPNLLVSGTAKYTDGTILGEGIEDIIAGTNISIDKTDPKNPIISSFGGGGGGGGYETPFEVRDALESLTGEDRLDASAIKNLSSTGLTPEQEAKLENTPLDTISELGNKVDKEEGKGLSSNDYTSAEKNKLENIEEEAQKNVQSDWNQENSNSDDFIKNKPSLFSGSYNDLTDVPSSFPSTIEDVNGLESELIDLQDQITTNENKLEYVLNFPPDVLNYDFKETIDIKINSIKIEPESGQTVDLGGYILGETLEAYTVLSISVNQGGIIELIGERV